MCVREMSEIELVSVDEMISILHDCDLNALVAALRIATFGLPVSDGRPQQPGFEQSS